MESKYDFKITEDIQRMFHLMIVPRKIQIRINFKIISNNISTKLEAKRPKTIQAVYWHQQNILQNNLKNMKF